MSRNPQTNQSKENWSIIQNVKTFFSKSTETGANESCIEYTFKAADEKLILKHINAGFNCCPGELTCIITYSVDTLIIEEFESAALCNCDCLFDLDIEVEGIEPGVYFMKFVEPYIQGQKRLEFSVDLQHNPSGKYCVERNQYPWGI